MDKPTLYIVQNIFVFMEECYVEEPREQDRYTFNPLYVKTEEASRKLHELIGKVFPFLEYAPFESAQSVSWGNVFISSYLANPALIEPISREKLILVEDGTFDYIDSDETSSYDLYEDNDLYVFSPDAASKSAHRAHIHELSVNKKVHLQFEQAFASAMRNLKALEPNTPILFTTPLEEDFGASDYDLRHLIRHLETRFGHADIIVKRHPRDTFEYTSDIINFVECNSAIPGQIVDSIYSGEAIYLFPSTVYMMTQSEKDVVFLCALPENARYCESFERVLELPVFARKRFRRERVPVNNAKKIRLFVSSTFQDFVKERELLNEKIFPEIRAYCEAAGFAFQPVDLRFGIASGAAETNSIIDICLNEVQRCQDTGYVLNFMLLIGERYGWIPNPTHIERPEFERVLSQCPDFAREYRELLERWYYLDENQIPESYVLKQRTDFDPEEPEYQDFAQASQHRNDKLNELFERLRANEPASSPDSKPNPPSATRLEIQKGVLEIDEPYRLRNILCIFRDTAPECTDDTRRTNIEADRAEQVRMLRDEIVKRTQGEGDQKASATTFVKRFEYSDQREDEYCNAFREEVAQSLKALVDASISQHIDIQPSEQEQHKRYMLERARNFEAQRDIIEAIEDHLRRGRDTPLPIRPLVLEGPRGSGKSSIMAKVISNCIETCGIQNVYYRFVGVTAKSSNLLECVNSLLEQLYPLVYSDNKFTPSASFGEAARRFKAGLTAIPPQRHIYIFIDAIDQFSSFANEDAASWIPHSLPANVSLVYSRLAQRPTGSNSIFIGSTVFTREETERIVLSLLKPYGRRLDSNQLDFVYRLYCNVKRPIYLRLVSALLRTWRSGVTYPATELGYPAESIPSGLSAQDHVRTVTHAIIDRLCDLNAFGPELVNTVFGLILASTNGISEQEIVDIVSSMSAVREEYAVVFKDSGTWESDRKLPHMVWSRLHLSIAPFLKTTELHETELLDFFHLIIKEVAEDYVGDDRINSCREAIIAYFEDEATQPLRFASASNSATNLRKITELPAQYMHFLDADHDGEDSIHALAFLKLLSNREYVIEKTANGLLGVLIDEVYALYDWLGRQGPTYADSQRELVASLFEGIVSVDRDSRQFGAYFEMVHSYLVFKPDSSLHRDFFELAASSDQFGTPVFLARFTRLICQLKVANQKRRGPEIENAKAILDSARENIRLLMKPIAEYGDEQLSIRFNEEISRFYYDTAYVKYLCHEPEAVDDMRKSIDYAVKSGNKVGELISTCVLSQMNFYMNMLSEGRMNMSRLDELIETASIAENTFLGMQSVDENSSRWVANTYRYLMQANMFKYFYDDNLGEQERRALAETIKLLSDSYFSNPWIKSNLNSEQPASYEALITSDNPLDWKRALLLIQGSDDIMGAEVLKRDFGIFEIWKALKALKLLYTETNDETYRQAMREYVDMIRADTKPIRGNRYFRGLIELDMGCLL